MTFPRASSLFLCFYLMALLLYRTSDAALSSSIPQVINCSTSGNYTISSAYAANVHQFLASLPENAVSKNGGFYNGTVGKGSDTVYGLAMCPADYSRADCSDCLMAAAGSNADGLTDNCPGSTTVLAMFDRCLVRYSNVNFFGTPEIGVVLAVSGQTVFTSATGLYGLKVAQSFKDRTAEAMALPQRFSASATDPYTFVQCTWDLSADKCKQCLDVLSANASSLTAIRMDGERKSYSCTVRYCNTSFMVVPLTDAPGSGPTPQSVDQTGTSPPPSTASGLRRIATVVGAVIAVLVMACLAAFLWYKSRQQRKLHNTQGSMDIQIEPTSVSTVLHRVFTHQQLADATHDFSEDEKLGQGSFGSVYRGRLLEVEGPGRHVAVKKMTDVTAPLARKDFDNEIRVMSPLNHRNIIRLVGWCQDESNLLLVYELMEKGNLEHQLYNSIAMDTDLHGISDPGTTLLLDWQKRNNILIGIATGLVYLHCECEERLLHRDIKPGNVMLDGSFNAKLCDFGLVTQFRHNQTSRSTDNIRGTPGYIDPAYADNGRACEQNDVYSFGIVLLEVVCCRRPTVTLIGDRMRNNLIEMVRRCHYQGNGILGAADRRLRGLFDEQLRRVLVIGLSCVHPDRHERPHIRTVLGCLTGQIATLPSIPTQINILPTVNESGSRSDEDTGTAAFLTSQC
ncbi:hypothetical protein ACQ4PT_065595 [Festuca glaucescens]